ncbi:MAG: hypothetical protein ACHQ4J_01895 [Candidatus Binatia bacterium]
MGRIKGQRHVVTRSDATFDTSEALRLRLSKHLSYSDLGKHFGVTPETVWKRLRWFHDMVREPDQVQAFKTEEANLLDGLRMQVLANMCNPGRLERAQLRDLGVVYGILKDKERLMRGQSTSNIGLRSTVILAAHGVPTVAPPKRFRSS